MKGLATRLAALAARVLLYWALGFGVYQFLGISRYGPGEAPPGHFPIVLEAVGGGAPVLSKWREMEGGRPRDAAYSAHLKAEAGDFALPATSDFVPTVSYRQERLAGGGSEVWVDYRDEDYGFESRYRVDQGVVTPLALHSGHGMVLAFSALLGFLIGRTLLWGIGRLGRGRRD